MEQKRGEGKQRFKKGGGKLGQGVGALKREAGTPLRIMFILILDRCFFDGFEQNKMNKGAIICLHHYVSFYFKFVCFP